MVHYHGTPINPLMAAWRVVAAGHAFVSYSQPDQLPWVVEVAQSFALDNGAYSAWRAGRQVTDWRPYYAWAGCGLAIPSCDFAVIPDVIDGTEEQNDALLAEWPHPVWFGAPVWHLHESFARLERLAHEWPRVCLGSSGEYARVGTRAWWRRMADVMAVVCDGQGRPVVRLHGLRMLNPAVFTRLPLASADSTNVARNIGIDAAWRGTYMPPNKEMRAVVLRSRIEAYNSPARWDVRQSYQAQPEQVLLEGV